MATRSRRALPLVTILLIAAVALGTVLAQGWSPALGLDLQGGVSVVYRATGDVPDEAIDDAIEIIRSRVDALGVAEPEILRQGDSIVVNLPGVADRERALEVIGRTAELRFRPVLLGIPYATQAQVEAAAATSTTTSTTVAGDPAASTTSTTAPPADTTSTTEDALGVPIGLTEGEFAAVLPAQDAGTTTTTTAPTTTAPTTAPTTTTAPVDPNAPTTVPPSGEPIDPDDGCFQLGGTTPTAEDVAEATVTLPGRLEADADAAAALSRECFQLGPVPTDGEQELVGSIVKNPEKRIDTGEWQVALEIDGDALTLFNQIALECNTGGPTCPTQRLAIVLDGEVVSAPVIREPSFAGGSLSISGNFTESQAADLALILRFGALPVELEVQTVQTVSATLGEDSLRAGVIAGAIGVALVVVYLFAYYRALGLVVVAGTLVWSALNFAVIAWLGETQDLALSLAGVTGIVISIGVTVDSYVVYFERLKDEIRAGRTIRSSIDRGFERAFRTILAANISSLIGAVFLYVLTVGPVRGFAFFLGLSTILGLLVAYFFTRPVVALLGRSQLFTSHPILGVGRGLGVEEVSA